MKWLSTAFTVGIALLTTERVAAQSESPADFLAVPNRQRVQQEQSPVGVGRPWVWEVIGAHCTVWVAGCLHLATSSDTAAYPAYLPFYRAAATLWFETAPGAWASPSDRQLVSRLGYLADHQSLADKVQKSTWTQLTSLVGQNPGEVARFSRMAPWLAAFTLSQEGYRRVGLHDEQSLQSYLERLATEDRKPVGGIESVKDQVSAMADASLAEQEQFLRETISGMSALAGNTHAMRQAWLSGDVATMKNALGLNTAQARSAMHQSVIGQRNQHWVQKIRTELAGRPSNTLILVGVEHLIATPYALPDLLEQAGLSVRRVSRPD